MSNQIAAKVKKKLNNAISSVVNDLKLYVKNPEKDFSRTKLLSMEDVLKAHINFEGKSLTNEIPELFQDRVAERIPTKSAFIQRTNQINTEAFQQVFLNFTNSLDADSTLNGFRLIACDGSDINIPKNSAYEGTLIEKEGKTGYNQVHLNATFDILNNIYTDVHIEPEIGSNERNALYVMAKRCKFKKKAVFIADRGYEGFNIIAKLQRCNANFVIRLKDISSNGILASFDSSGLDDEFDVDFSTTLTCSTKNQYKLYDSYTHIQKSNFDFFNDDSPTYNFKVRVCRFKISDGGYECVATSLNRRKFPVDLVKKLYNMRWGIETSFRELKYTIDLLHFHSKRKDSILKEFYSRLTVFNFAQHVNHLIAKSIISSDKNKYVYTTNFAAAAAVCKRFLKPGGDKIDVYGLCLRDLVPIRPNRKSLRKVRQQSAKSFLYRAS